MIFKEPLSIFFFCNFIHLTLCDVNFKNALYGDNDSCRGKVLLSKYTYSTVKTRSAIQCAFTCSVENTCVSFHFEKSSLKCNLNKYPSSADCAAMTTSNDAKHFDKIKPLVCLNGGHNVNGTCKCVDGYVGTMCERLMTDCTEGSSSGNDYNNGIYSIQPPSATTSFPVYCIMNFGGRTMVQYRVSENENFNRKWNDYRDGFGSLRSDHWLGLQNIYQIVRNRNFILYIQMRLKNGTFYQQHVLNFSIGDETSGYVMHFLTSVSKSRNPLGDSMSSLNGSKFSTPDVDNDNLTDGNCAEQFASGFWFNACADCNPNGRLLKPADGKRTNNNSEVFWTYDLGDNAPYKTQMWLKAV